MVASNTVQILSNKSEEIAALMEFVKNPALADKLAQEVKKLNQLTEDEEKRLHDAQITIQQKDKTEKELAVLRAQMAREVEDHKTALAAELDNHAAKMDVENKALEKAKAELDEKQAELDAREVQLNQKENQLKEKAAIMRGLVSE